MDFPPQAPDLNPTENVWGHLKKELTRQSVTQITNSLVENFQFR